MQNCSSSSNESMPRICTTKESNAQKESKKQMKGVYSLWVKRCNFMKDSPFSGCAGDLAQCKLMNYSF